MSASHADAETFRVRVRGGTLFRRVIAPALKIAVVARLVTPERGYAIARNWFERHVKIEVIQ